ncbi:hypothetical protein RKD55_000551 [Rossellomorea marisflavi]
MLRTGLNDVKFTDATILSGLHRAAPLDFIGLDQLPYLQDVGRICDPKLCPEPFARHLSIRILDIESFLCVDKIIFTIFFYTNNLKINYLFL